MLFEILDHAQIGSGAIVIFEECEYVLPWPEYGEDAVFHASFDVIWKAHLAVVILNVIRSNRTKKRL